MNKEILKNISYGVYIVSSLDGERQTGCVANSIMQVTHDVIAISINHENFTNECIKKSKRVAVSILGENVENNVIPVFGFQSGRTNDKFKMIKNFTKDDLGIIETALGYIICEPVDVAETETHSVFLCKIIDGEILNPQPPMTYAYYQKVKNGRSPKTAPTYIEQ